jgi:hypothetical protein
VNCLFEDIEETHRAFDNASSAEATSSFTERSPDLQLKLEPNEVQLEQTDSFSDDWRKRARLVKACSPSIDGDNWQRRRRQQQRQSAQASSIDSSLRDKEHEELNAYNQSNRSVYRVDNQEAQREKCVKEKHEDENEKQASLWSQWSRPSTDNITHSSKRIKVQHNHTDNGLLCPVEEEFIRSPMTQCVPVTQCLAVKAVKTLLFIIFKFKI